MRVIAAALLLILPCVAAAQESPADLLAAGKKLYEGRKYKESQAAYEKARLAADAAGDSITAARAKLGLASLKTFYGAFDEGITLATEARATFEAAGDQRGLAAALHMLGNLHIGSAKFAVAGDYFRRCAALPEGGRKALCLEALGECQESLGDYRLSMATLHEAIEAAAATNNRTVHAAALGGMGDIYMNQGNGELAVHYLQKSIEMFRELGNIPMVTKSLNNLAISYNVLGLSDRALEVYRENLATMEGLKYTRGVNMSKMNIGATLVNLGRYEEGAQVLAELLPEFDRLNDPNSRANVRRLLAEIEEKRGNLSGALDHALAANAERTDQIKDVYLSRTLLGHIYRRLGRPEEARTFLTGAIDAVESMHGHSTGGEVHFFDERTESYTEMAILMIDEGRIEDAFQYAERYRSRVLIDVLRSGPSGRSPALTDDERKRERELAERLSALHRETTPAAGPELAERITAARGDYDAFEQELAEAHPRLRVERGTLQPVTARDVLPRLPPDSALVEYLVTAEKTYAFVIAGGRIEMRTIDVPRDTLAKEADSFRALLAGRRPDFRDDARSLYRTLVAPIADLLAKRRSWILVPDGPLWNLPFQALVDARGSYLAEHAAIVYAPSTAAWLEMSGAPHTASADGRHELLAFGNPTTPSAAGVEGTRGSFAPLPEAETEVKGAARFYGAGSAVYVRDQATEERFKAEASRYRVLHVAGHGVLNDASPMHSYLLLASGNGKTEDGYLEAGEVMQMDLGADLVVLSACDTARGQYAAGEGIIGFSWALFAARCRTQVVSQWKVDSAATSLLMRNFHKNLRNDRTKAAGALQKTIVSMLKTKSYRHPFYWASFVVLGDAL